MNKIIKNKFLFLSVILVLNSCSMLDASSTASKENLRKFDLNPGVVEYVKRRQDLGLFDEIDTKRVDAFLKLNRPIMFKTSRREDAENRGKIFYGNLKDKADSGMLKTRSDFLKLNFYVGHLDEITKHVQYPVGIITCSRDLTIRCWQPDGHCLVMIGHEAPIVDICYGDRWIASYDCSGDICFWNIDDMRIKGFSLNRPIETIGYRSSDNMFYIKSLLSGRNLYFRVSGDTMVHVKNTENS